MKRLKGVVIRNYNESGEESELRKTKNKLDKKSYNSLSSILIKYFQKGKFLVKCISAVFKQNITLIRSTKKNISVNLIIAPGVRLFKGQEFQNPQSYLAFILEGYNNCVNKKMLSEKIKNSELLIIFDSCIISSLRKGRYFNAGEVVIIDFLFIVIMFFSPLFLYSFIVGFFSKIGKIRKANMLAFGVPKMKETLAYYLYYKSANHILKNFSEFDSVFLSSNSFMFEALRALLMESRACKNIFEVMHGIPSRLKEQYFMNLIQLEFDSFNCTKTNIITLIPSIQDKYLSFYNDRVLKGISVSAYFNKYLYFEGFNLKSKSKPSMWVEDKYYEYFKNELGSTDTVNIFFVGGNALGNSYDESDSFLVEQNLLETINNIWVSKKKNFRIIYSKHPSANFSATDISTCFNNQNVVFCHDTVYSLLISDFCLGIISSTLFEAEYLGIPTYSPMSLEDGLYSEEILNTITNSSKYYGGSKGFRIELDKFFSADSIDRDLKGRALKRFQNICNF